nr:methyltransferase [Paeniglutamicibacter cryotolerans]
MPLDFTALRRRPDVEAPNLQAHDAADLLLLDTARESGALAAAADGKLVVLGDHYGALVLGAVARGATGVRVHQDGLSGQRAIDANAAGLLPQSAGAYRHLPLDAALVEGATLVLMALPRSLDALEEMAALLAKHADPSVTLLATGRVKHMSLAMNEVLGRYFGEVSAGLARQKSRVLTASAPLAPDALPASRFPLACAHAVGLASDLELRAFGATFGGAKLDPGTRFLLLHLAGAREAATAIDLGCGNGTITAYLALIRPSMHVLGCDQSASAVASTLATAAANGVTARVTALRDDALSAQPDASARLIVLNPPFHMGNTVHAGIALKLIADAGRALEPGGELWCVWNSHLGYRGALEKLVGPTRQVDRNPKFTVTVSTRK